MLAPPLQRLSGRRGHGGVHRRWRSRGRGSGRSREQSRQQERHQPTRHKRCRQHPHGLAHAARSPGRRAAGYTSGRNSGRGSSTPARRLALAGILAAVEAGSGDGGRRVRPAFGILAHAEAAPADGIPHAGLGQVQPDWPEFQALAKSPRHDLPSVTRRAAQEASHPRRFQRRSEISQPEDAPPGAARSRSSPPAAMPPSARLGSRGTCAGTIHHVTLPGS
jgi:hypothetical protein